MIKDKYVGAFITGLDFQYIKKQAEKRDISKSRFIRKIIRWYRKRKRKK